MSFLLVGNPSEERLRASRSDKQKVIILMVFLVIRNVPAICFVLLLSTALISPIYHHHDHTAGHHHYPIDHRHADHEHPDKDVRESLSDGREHISPHLHIEKDFGESNAHQYRQYKLQKASVLDTTSFVSTCAQVFDKLTCYPQKIKPAISFVKPFSGLSPPAC